MIKFNPTLNSKGGVVVEYYTTMSKVLAFGRSKPLPYSIYIIGAKRPSIPNSKFRIPNFSVLTTKKSGRLPPLLITQNQASSHREPQ